MAYLRLFQLYYIILYDNKLTTLQIYVKNIESSHVHKNTDQVHTILQQGFPKDLNPAGETKHR